MIKAGLAGGIGSGKSGVANAFEVLGVPVYYADDRAKQLMLRPEIMHAINSELGTCVFQNGQLQREKLAGIIFNDEAARQKVNKIVHPAVYNDFDNWASQQNASLVMVEAAIMFETGFYKKLDATILVLATEEERIARVIQRDQASTNSVLNRIKSQNDPEEHKHLATYLIYNNNSDEVLPQILNILKQLRHG
jgi:dephospho-CoA kinase